MATTPRTRQSTIPLSARGPARPSPGGARTIDNEPVPPKVRAGLPTPPAPPTPGGEHGDPKPSPRPKFIPNAKMVSEARKTAKPIPAKPTPTSKAYNAITGKNGATGSGSGFTPLAAGRKSYGAGRAAPNVGKTSNRTGYAVRDNINKLRTDARKAALKKFSGG